MRIALLLLVACGSSVEPKGVTISVDGKAHPIQSAVIHGPHLALSTGTMDCIDVPMADVMLSQSEFGWTLAVGGKLSMGRVDALSDVTLSVASGVVTVAGRAKIGAHELELSGSIRARECVD